MIFKTADTWKAHDRQRDFSILLPLINEMKK